MRQTQGMRGAAVFVPWVVDGVPPAVRAAFLGTLPPPVRVLNSLFWEAG